MSFFQTLEDDAITLIWRRFDAFLIGEFKKENLGLTEDEIDSAIENGILTIK